MPSVNSIVITALVVSIMLNIYQFFNHRRKVVWYNSILDAIPFPMSITDMEMKWTFVNKAVEDMLAVKRKDVVGKHCSNWGAGICNTNNCGIACLRRGNSQTRFQQAGMDFLVHIAYLADSSGKAMGHIEVVQDISSLVKVETTAAELVRELNKSPVQGSGFASRSLSEANATERVSSMHRLNDSVADIAEKMRNNSVNADQALGLSDETRQSASVCNSKMEQMVTAVQEINEASQAIRKVMKIIDDIAFQINILSLNAAVEAARAGEAGRGFAVVAEEVSRLAAQSASAANDTNGLISDSISKAEFGNSIAQETARALAEITSSIEINRQLIGEIAHSTDEQSGEIAVVSEGIKRMYDAVQNYLQHATALIE